MSMTPIRSHWLVERLCFCTAVQTVLHLLKAFRNERQAPAGQCPQWNEWIEDTSCISRKEIYYHAKILCPPPYGGGYAHAHNGYSQDDSVTRIRRAKGPEISVSARVDRYNPSGGANARDAAQVTYSGSLRQNPYKNDDDSNPYNPNHPVAYFTQSSQYISYPLAPVVPVVPPVIGAIAPPAIVPSYSIDGGYALSGYNGAYQQPAYGAGESHNVYVYKPSYGYQVTSYPSYEKPQYSTDEHSCGACAVLIRCRARRHKYDCGPAKEVQQIPCPQLYKSPACKHNHYECLALAAHSYFVDTNEENPPDWQRVTHKRDCCRDDEYGDCCTSSAAPAVGGVQPTAAGVAPANNEEIIVDARARDAATQRLHDVNIKNDDAKSQGQHNVDGERSETQYRFLPAHENAAHQRHTRSYIVFEDGCLCCCQPFVPVHYHCELCDATRDATPTVGYSNQGQALTPINCPALGTVTGMGEPEITRRTNPTASTTAPKTTPTTRQSATTTTSSTTTTSTSTTTSTTTTTTTPQNFPPGFGPIIGYGLLRGFRPGSSGSDVAISVATPEKQQPDPHPPLLFLTPPPGGELAIYAFTGSAAEITNHAPPVSVQPESKSVKLVFRQEQPYTAVDSSLSTVALAVQVSNIDTVGPIAAVNGTIDESKLTSDTANFISATTVTKETKLTEATSSSTKPNVNPQSSAAVSLNFPTYPPDPSSNDPNPAVTRRLPLRGRGYIASNEDRVPDTGPQTDPGSGVQVTPEPIPHVMMNSDADEGPYILPAPVNRDGLAGVGRKVVPSGWTDVDLYEDRVDEPPLTLDEAGYSETVTN